jgi:hypothetical protein
VTLEPLGLISTAVFASCPQCSAGEQAALGCIIVSTESHKMGNQRVFCMSIFLVHLVSWFGLVWLDVKLSLAIVAWIVFTEKQMPELVFVICVFFPNIRDRNRPRGKPQVSGRYFDFLWQF